MLSGQVFFSRPPRSPPRSEEMKIFSHLDLQTFSRLIFIMAKVFAKTSQNNIENQDLNNEMGYVYLAVSVPSKTRLTTLFTQDYYIEFRKILCCHSSF